jgi:hypothetical protein
LYASELTDDWGLSSGFWMGTGDRKDQSMIRRLMGLSAFRKERRAEG